eukprot:m.60099 g.60099  ORF g.60099 m.60099 type:complete len:69 (-) comp12271_c0_seq4:230-436(-)
MPSWRPGQRHPSLPSLSSSECHPREEHLLPLLVVAAAAGQSPATTLFQASTLNVETLDFKFADPPACV